MVQYQKLLREIITGGIFSLKIDEPLIQQYEEAYLGRDYPKLREIVLKIIEILNKQIFPLARNLAELFKGLKEFETDLLYNNLDYYRDHFVHSFNIFLLGCYLIQTAISNDFELDFLSNTNRNGFIRVWYIASIYHDIGYMVEKLFQIRQKIQKKYFSKISGLNLTSFELEISKNLESLFEIYIERFCIGFLEGEKCLLEGDIKSDKPKLGPLKNQLMGAYNNRDHGVISALFLYYTFLLDVDINTEQEPYYRELNIACSAIALHNTGLNEKFYNINQKSNPFGSILILCDNVQEWGRPISLSTFNDYLIWKEIIISCDNEADTIKIEFSFTEDVTDVVLNQISSKVYKSLDDIFTNTIVKGSNFVLKYSNSSTSRERKYTFDRECYKFT